MGSLSNNKSKAPGEIFVSRVSGSIVRAEMAGVASLAIHVENALNPDLNVHGLRYRMDVVDDGISIVAAGSGLEDVLALADISTRTPKIAGELVDLIDDVLKDHQDEILEFFRANLDETLVQTEKAYDVSKKYVAAIERRAIGVGRRLSRMEAELRNHGINDPVVTLPSKRAASSYGHFRVAASHRRDAYLITSDHRSANRIDQRISIQGVLCVKRDGSFDPRGNLHCQVDAPGIDEAEFHKSISNLIADFDARAPWARLAAMSFHTRSVLGTLERRLEQGLSDSDTAWKRLSAFRRYHDEAIAALSYPSSPLRP